MNIVLACFNWLTNLMGVIGWCFILFLLYNRFVKRHINHCRYLINKYRLCRRIVGRVNFRKLSISYFPEMVAQSYWTPMEWLALYACNCVNLNINQLMVLKEFKKRGHVKQVHLLCVLTPKGKRLKDAQARYCKH